MIGLAKLFRDDICPQCGIGTLRRTPRGNWMRWLPVSKQLQCRSCQARYLTLIGWAIRLPKNPKKTPE